MPHKKQPKSALDGEKDAFTVNPWEVMAQVRKNPRLSPADLALIEAVHSQFEHAGSKYADAASVLDAMRSAYNHGLVIGAYVSGDDTAVLGETKRLLTAIRQSQAGKSSGDRRRLRSEKKRKDAEEIAKKLRLTKPQIPTATLADKIIQKLGVGAPSAETVERWLRQFEKDGSLPRAKRS